MTTAASAVLVLLAAQPVLGQLRQYAEPGSLAERKIPARETLRERMTEAPWRAGRWRLVPRLSVGDFVYSNNALDDNEASERVSDLRGVAAAGLDAYLPVGEDVIFAAFVAPSYTWWRDNDRLSRFNQSYGAALFGLFNRLSTEASVKRTEVESPINNELRLPAVLRSESALFDARVSIRGPWQVFAAVGLTQSRYPNAPDLIDRAPNLPLLERDDEVLSAGLAYDIPDRFNLGVGWRRVDSRFLVDPRLRSNKGEYPFLSLRVPGNKLQVDAEFGLRQLEFATGSELAEAEEAVGTLRASLDVANRTSFAIYSGRDVVYSALDAGGFFASQRTGVALNWGESASLRASIFAEVGDDEFASAGGGATGRLDDSESFGVQLQLPLRWGLELRLGVTETTVDSTVDAFDRSLTSVLSSVSLDLPGFPF